jgi:hypothetical protein
VLNSDTRFTLLELVRKSHIATHAAFDRQSLDAIHDYCSVPSLELISVHLYFAAASVFRFLLVGHSDARVIKRL